MTSQELIDKAKNFRISGQNGLADKLYDQLLSTEPNNHNFIFYKAVNLAESNPELAILLLKKVIEIDQKVLSALRNITVIASKSGKHSLAITVFNELIEKYPTSLEIIYHRALQIKSGGNNLQSLLELYKVVDNSIINNNAEAFLANQISTDIASSKTELRNETNSKPIPRIANEEELKTVKMKEYQYSLPAKLFGDENFSVDFGEMVGWTIKEVIKKRPDYISWCILNLDNFCVSEEVIELVKQRGINVSESEKVNLFKLKIYDSQQSRTVVDGNFPDRFHIDKDGNIII